jgi:DNA-binding IscR family transcriptional regulator
MARQEKPATSEVLAKAMRTNAVVLRRTMAGLRDKGFVRSEKGHGGGWTLACDLSKVTMLDIYLALGKPALFALGNRSDTPDCLVEKAVNANLNQAFLEVEQRLMTRFGDITLSMLSADLQLQAKQRRDALDVEKILGDSV